MARICIQNLGKYNEGELLYEWVDLPVSNEELDDVYDRIQICHGDKEYYNDCGCPYEEIMLADWEDFGSYPVSEWSNVQDLNEVAEFLDGLTDLDREVFDFFIGDGYDFEDAKDRVKLSEYTYFKADTETDLAYEYIDSVYGAIDYVDKNTLERYFDYEAFGRDLAFDFSQTNSGFICAT